MQAKQSFKQSALPAILAALLFLPGMAVRAESPGVRQQVLHSSGQVAPDFTPPDPARFGVAMELGDLEQARKWLDQGLHPDYMADRVGSGLMIGAWEGNLALMELFYSRGADVNLVNQAGEQALLLAAWKGNRQIVDWLLERGAQLNRAPGQWSALHYAAFSGHRELVSHLLEKGAHIDARSPNGSTPLMMAIYDGKPEVARLLIERGANKELRNDWGDGAMEWAMRFNQIGVARLIGSPEEFIAAANKPKESWGQDWRSEMAPPELDRLIQSRRQLVAKGLSVEEIDRNIAALRARYAKASLSQEALPPRSTALEITARRASPRQQGARVVQNPGPYRLPPRAPNKLPARQ